MDARLAKSTFLDIKRVLDQALVKFWLVDGTVLGALRDGGFIIGDTDMDLRVLVVDWDSEKMSKKFTDAGFDYMHIMDPPRYKDMVVGAVVFKRGIKTDICLGYDYPPTKRIVVLASQPRAHVTVLPAALFRKDEDYFISFCGVRVRVPNPPEQYLTVRYGADWKSPTTENYPKICKLISIKRYVDYFHKHPEVNKKGGK